MDLETSDPHWLEKRRRISRSLERNGLSYHRGGRILGGNTSTPTRSLLAILQERDFNALEREFDRALDSIIADPPAALTASCAILEGLFKIYIQDRRLEMPSDQSIMSLWRAVQQDLGLRSGSVEDRDLHQILAGLSSIVNGVGSFRTHAGSAHGHGRASYPVEARHARLAVHAAHTLATFVIETWDSTRGERN
jgi:hypothetical protein